MSVLCLKHTKVEGDVKYDLDNIICRVFDPTDDYWARHPTYKNYYFGKKDKGIYNKTTNTYPSGDKGDRFSIKIGEKKTSVRYITLIWESFNDQLLDDTTHRLSFVDSTITGDVKYSLDNIKYEKIVCKQCDTEFAQTHVGVQYCCSIECTELFFNNKRRQKNESCSLSHLRTMINVNKYSFGDVTAEDINTKNSHTDCPYCGIELHKCKSKSGKKYNPCQWTIDAKIPESKGGKHSDIDNLTTCCQFCNTMKNDTDYNTWNNVVLPMLKGELNEIDLSNENYYSVDNCGIENVKHPWNSLTDKRRNGYEQNPWKYSSALKWFKQIWMNNERDAMGFPLIMLKSSPFNTSVDAKIPTDGHTEKNIHLITKTMNLGKNELTMDEFNDRINQTTI